MRGEGEGGAKCKVQGVPDKRGAKLVNALFTVFNYTLEEEEGAESWGRGALGGLPPHPLQYIPRGRAEGHEISFGMQSAIG